MNNSTVIKKEKENHFKFKYSFFSFFRRSIFDDIHFRHIVFLTEIKFCQNASFLYFCKIITATTNYL